MDTEVEDFLAHYGVKGQKWGVRRKKKKAAIDAIRVNRTPQDVRARRAAAAIGAIVAGPLGLAVVGGINTASTHREARNLLADEEN